MGAHPVRESLWRKARRLRTRVLRMFLLGHGAATLLSVPGDEIARDEVRRNFLANLTDVHSAKRRSSETREDFLEGGWPR